MYREIVFDNLPRGGHGAEIGVHLGDFSRRLLDRAKPARLHLIDPWLYRAEPEYAEAWYGSTWADQDEMDRRHDHVVGRFQEQITSGRVKVHRAISTVALATFPDWSLDWIYIDGDHTYDAVRRDLDLALAKVRPDGLIVCDDYGIAGWWNAGVTRAVDQIVASGRASRELIAMSQCFLRPSQIGKGGS